MNISVTLLSALVNHLSDVCRTLWARYLVHVYTQECFVTPPTLGRRSPNHLACGALCTIWPSSDSTLLLNWTFSDTLENFSSGCDSHQYLPHPAILLAVFFYLPHHQLIKLTLIFIISIVINIILITILVIILIKILRSTSRTGIHSLAEWLRGRGWHTGTAAGPLIPLLPYGQSL